MSLNPWKNIIKKKTNNVNQLNQPTEQNKQNQSNNLFQLNKNVQKKEFDLEKFQNDMKNTYYFIQKHTSFLYVLLMRNTSPPLTSILQE